MSIRTTGYVPNLRAPSRQTPSQRMWLIVALCVFLPPVGLLMLWTQARNPLRGKLIVSIIAVLSMTLMLTIYISTHQSPKYAQVPPSYQYLGQQVGQNGYYDATRGLTTPEPDASAQQAGAQQPSATIIPAAPGY